MEAVGELVRCPACRAENRDTTCRRCRADLSLLVALEQERHWALARARRALACGSHLEAESAARHAHQLRAAPDSAGLLGLAALLRRDFGAALSLYREASSRGAASEPGPP